MPNTEDVKSDTALTFNEVALLAGVPERSVTKAVEEGVLSSRKVGSSAWRLWSGKAVLDMPAVCYIGLVHDLRESGWSVPLSEKKRIASYVWAFWSHEVISDLEFGGPLVLRKSKCLPILRHCMSATKKYVSTRNRWIVSDDAIMGATPVILGTRMTVYSVLGRVDGGDTIDEIAEENPDVHREALDAALLYARANPMRGRPSGRPWIRAA